MKPDSKDKGKAVVTDDDPLDIPEAPSVNDQLHCEIDGCNYGNFLIQNHLNFKKTSLPVQMMYYNSDSWVQFAPEVVEPIRAGFEEGKSMIEIGVGGDRFLFDLYRMTQVDLESGDYRSISWIDVDGKCFFPKTFVDEFQVVKNIRIDPIPEVLEIGGPSNVGLSRWPNTRLLEERERLHQMVKDLFMSGLGFFERNIKITAIRHCIRTGPTDKARHQVYLKHVEITRVARGEGNETLAWHGTSAQGVDGILSYGFTGPSKVYGSHSHGIGVYLSPMRSPHMSAMLSEVDDYGEKHVVLCRMIMGKREKIEAGSQQLCPSSVDFDSGVDDLQNPKWHVVWCAYMNTHILPMDVLSFKMS